MLRRCGCCAPSAALCLDFLRVYINHPAQYVTFVLLMQDGAAAVQELLQGCAVAAFYQHLGAFAVGDALGRHGHGRVAGDVGCSGQVLGCLVGGVEEVLCGLLLAAFGADECLKAKWGHGCGLALLQLLLGKGGVVVLLQGCK